MARSLRTRSTSCPSPLTVRHTICNRTYEIRKSYHNCVNEPRPLFAKQRKLWVSFTFYLSSDLEARQMMCFSFIFFFVYYFNILLFCHPFLFIRLSFIIILYFFFPFGFIHCMDGMAFETVKP